MPSIINPGAPRRQSGLSEILGTVLTGLSIAEKVHGLKAASEDREILAKQRKLEEEREQQQLAREDEQRQRRDQGIVTPTEQLGLQAKGVQFVPGPAGGTGPLQPGMVRLQTPSGSPLFATVKRRPELQRVETVDDAGNAVTRFVTAQEGLSLPKPKNTLRPPRARLDTRFVENPETGEIEEKVVELLPGQQLPAEAPSPKEVRRDVRNLVKDTEQHRSALQGIESVEKQLGFDLEDYDPKTGTVGGEKVDIPGVSIPLYGRAAPTDEARFLQDRIARVFNIELKTRSGAAVTDQELRRLREEFGQGKYNTEEQLVNALAEYKRLALEAMESHEASFDPLVLREYMERENALTSRSFKSQRSVADRPPTREEALEELRRRRRTVDNAGSQPVQ